MNTVFPTHMKNLAIVKNVSILGLMAAIGTGLYGVSVEAGDSTVPTDFTTIQQAIDDAGTVNGDMITILAGNHLPFTLNKAVHLVGAQAGVGACNRTGAESVITDPAGAGNLITLVSGSAGATIDGFHLLGDATGPTQGIVSTSGPIDNLQIRNNLFTGLTSSAIFLNDNGVDITVHANRIDGASKTGGGGAVHLDQDNFDGFHFTDNCVVDTATGAGFFVDGNRNVGVSGTRAPLFSGNLFDNQVTNVGANIGRFAIEFATISGNIFSNNGFDGLQGGPKGSVISRNVFSNNGRHGLRLTGFGGTGDATRGAQNNVVTENCVLKNGFAQDGRGIRFDDQFAGTMASNRVNRNNIADNNVGAENLSTDTIDAENNWWGDASGPSGDGSGSGDSVVGTTGGGAIDFDPFLAAEVPGTPCSQSTAALDHFVCYRVKENTKSQDQVPTLEDQFGLQEDVTVKNARILCVPVDKNGEGIANPEAHLTCYDLKSKQDPKIDVLVTHQFGEQELEVKKADLLCLPSAKEVLGPSQ